MPRLMLLRHAKAVPGEDGMADEDRALAKRGRRDTPAIGRFMASHALIPDLAVISTSRRTRETWELLAPTFPAPPPARFDSRVYAAPAENLLRLLAELGRETKSVLLVGHNPGFEELARVLVGAGETDALIRFGGSMPTASLAVIDLPRDWRRLEFGTGRLEVFVTPRSLERLAASE